MNATARIPRAWVPWALAMLLWPAVLPFPFMNNTGQFALMASRWAAGDVLYRDIADNRPPGSYAIWRVGLAVFGSERPHVFLDLTVQCVMLAGIMAVGRRFWGPGLALKAGVLYVVSAFAYLNADFLAESETFCMPVILAAIALAGIANERKDRPPGFLVFAALGALAGILIAVKLVPAASPLAIAGWLLWKRRRDQSAIVAAAGFGAGLAGSLAPWVIYLHSVGSLIPCARVFIDWGGPPTDVSELPSRLLKTPFLLLWGILYLVPCGILALLGLVRLRKVPAADADSLVITSLGAGMFVAALQNLWYGYHFLLSFPALVLLGARWWEIVRTEVKPVPEWKYASALIAAVIVLSPFVHRGGKWFGAIKLAAGLETREQYDARFTVPGMADPGPDRATAMRLAELTAPDERTLMWGFAPHVFFQAKRRPAARFIEHYPYACRNCNPALQTELLETMRARPPARVMVKFGEVNRSEFDGSEDTAQKHLETKFAPLWSFITENYELEERSGHFDIYRPKAAP